MGWILAFVFVLLAGATAGATLCGAARHGLDALWPLSAARFDEQVLLAPTIPEAGLLTLAVGIFVFGLFCFGRLRVKKVLPTTRERWGHCCTLGLLWSVFVLGGAVAFVIVGPDKGATAESIGTATIAAAAQAVVGLALAIALAFLPKSRAAFAALVMIWLLEVGSLTGVYLLGSGLLF